MRTLTLQSTGIVLLTIMTFGCTWTWNANCTWNANWTIQHEPVSFETHSFISSLEQHIIPNVTYVWQEINGFCAWASLAIIFQYLDVDTTLDRLLDVSGVGFGFYYLRADPTLLFFTGALGSQIPDSDFLAKTYGFDLTWYFGADTPGIGQLQSVLEQHGMNMTVLTSFTEGFEILKQDLVNNIPIMVSVNPLRFSTIRDYQALALPPDTLVGHGVVVVGYNESHVFVHDPGVGSFGAEYGYPADQRGKYAPIPLKEFQHAWEDRNLLATKFLPKPGFDLTSETLRSHTIERIISKLEGDYSAYAYAPVLMWLGADAFVKMGEDLLPKEFEVMLNSWDEYFGRNRTQLVTTLVTIKTAYLGTMTLAHEGMKRAAADLSDLLQGLSTYKDALDALTSTLNKFEGLVDLTVLQYPTDDSKRTNQTLFDEAFDPLIRALNESESLENAFQTVAPQFETLSPHVKSIGTSLKTFSAALKAAHSTFTELTLRPALQLALLGGVIVAVAELVRRKVRRG